MCCHLCNTEETRQQLNEEEEAFNAAAQAEQVEQDEAPAEEEVPQVDEAPAEQAEQDEAPAEEEQAADLVAFDGDAAEFTKQALGLVKDKGEQVWPEELPPVLQQQGVVGPVIKAKAFSSDELSPGGLVVVYFPSSSSWYAGSIESCKPEVVVVVCADGDRIELRPADLRGRKPNVLRCFSPADRFAALPADVKRKLAHLVAKASKVSRKRKHSG
jgi:hypothetical protein